MMQYTAIKKEFKHVGYHPGRYLHIADVTTRVVDFDHKEIERVDQVVIGSDEPMITQQVGEEARIKLVEEHPDFQFYREVEVAEVIMVEAFDRELAEQS
ncbi:hypothetical protein FPZ44_01980 [Paenibacillus agilis]|uniref:Uncharacterized protein n=2 Tax=Paenibacillus agilis TaxID=3020863 RepID=A0A559J3R6_9BACL|nr:hypothetical protein FPZ44_01980 [Paenibacillus agilis]